jgi:leader peptidase (prepilin peptidase)/N-methyltransferase
MFPILAALLTAAAVGAMAYFSPQAGSGFWVPFGAACGVCVGSFLNVVAHRFPKMLERAWRRDSLEFLQLPAEPEAPAFNLAVPQSRCPHCGHQIRAYENIPVVSYLFLRGRCSSCSKPISMRYPMVELFTGLITAAAFALFGATTATVVACGFIWVSLAIALIDAETFLIPDDLSLPLLWAGLALSYCGYGPTLATSVLGAMVGYGSLWLVNGAYKLVRKVEGMGHGDFKYLAACGAFLGAKPLVVVILAASVVGVALALGSAFIRSKTVKGDTALPFGPYLALGACTVLLLKEYLPTYLVV